jgi:uracil-DNA glycosylase
MENLLNEIRNCKVCEEHLPHGCNPIISASKKSKIVIIGQAPGRKVHDSSIPWNDKSGDNLREWLGVDKATFYDPDNFAIVGMGFCYPGTGKSGDLPPRKECAPLWHPKLQREMNDVELTILIGQYAQKYYLGKTAKRSLTETVGYFHEYLPNYFVLPHPSPRNNIWQSKNRWFPSEVLPNLKERVNFILK